MTETNSEIKEGRDTVAPWPPKISGLEKGAWDKKVRTGSADKILMHIKNGTWKDPVHAVRNTTGKNQKSIKSGLPAIMWSGTFSERNCKGFESHSGLVAVDIDHLNGIEEARLVSAKLSQSKHVVASFVSPSGRGVKAIYDCRGYGLENHKVAFRKACADASALTGLQTDPLNSDVCHLCFISYDPDLVMKWDTEPLPEPSDEENKEICKEMASDELTRQRSEVPRKTATESTLYGLAALRAECLTVSQTTEGERNTTLFKCSAKIGELVAGGEIEESEAENMLVDAGLDAGLDLYEASATASNGLTAGKMNPRGPSIDADEFNETLQPDLEKTANQATTTDGTVVTSVETFIDADQSKDSPVPPWRLVRSSDIRDIVMPTVLGPVIEALESVTVPPFPIEATIVKALVLAGCALSGYDELLYSPDMSEKHDWSKGHGKGLARVRIMTGGGQVPNIWGMLLGDASMGKDIGEVVSDLALKMGWGLGDSGSAEGIADAYVRCPNGLMNIHELLNWLDNKHWQSGAKSWMTARFNGGFFKSNLSKSNPSKLRQSPYCFPNVMSNVQPDVLARYARKEDLETGFLNRFLYSEVPELSWEATTIDISGEMEAAESALLRLLNVRGDFSAPENYSRRVRAIFNAHGAEFRGYSDRLAKEYMPRLALILSVPRIKNAVEPKSGGEIDFFSTSAGEVESEIKAISDQAWAGAEQLVLWFFAQGEKALGMVEEDDQAAKIERDHRRIARYIAKVNGKAMVSDISQNCGRGTDSAQRRKILEELVQRRVVNRSKEGVYSIRIMPPGW